MTKSPMEQWLRLMSDAMRGTADAQEAVRTLSDMSRSPDQLGRWMMRFMPSAGRISGSEEAFGDWLEDTWRSMGVVPRYRYLDLLERNERLRERLERAEKEIESLRQSSGRSELSQQEMKKALDMWGNVLQDSMKMQTEWMRTLSGSAGEKKPAEPEPEATPDPPTADEESGEKQS